MKRRIVWMIIIGLTLGLLVGRCSSPAAASAPALSFVEDHTGSAWDVVTATRIIDNQTRSSTRYGACRAGYPCIRVYERVMNSSWAGVTYWSGANATIYVNPQRNGYDYASKRQILVHELAHAFGVHWHSGGCGDIMAPSLHVPGCWLPPFRFTATQRAVMYTR